MEETKYLIKKKEPCPLCKGKGVRYNLDWMEFIERLQFGDQVDIEDFFRKKGYLNNTIDYYPEIASSCRECGGFGVREVEIPLQQALDELRDVE